MGYDDYDERQRLRREEQRREDQRREEQRREDKRNEDRRQDEEYRRRREAEKHQKFIHGVRTGDYDDWLRELGYVSPYPGSPRAAGAGDAHAGTPPPEAAPTREELAMQMLDNYYRALGEAHAFKGRLLNWIEYSDAFKPYSNSEMWLVGYRRQLRDWVAGIDPAWPGSVGLLTDYLNGNPGLASYGLLYDWLRQFRDVCDYVSFWRGMLR